MAGILVPFGYATPRAQERLEKLMLHNPEAVLVDIRYKARSRIGIWNKGPLTKKWEGRYFPLSALGNENYHNGGPIKIADPELGIPLLLQGLHKGATLILLCACNNYQTCHAKTVVELVKERMPEVEVNYLECRRQDMKILAQEG